jgi:hypothetical protein
VALHTPEEQHTLPHRTCPVLHEHAPLWQMSPVVPVPAGQTTPQLPQF